MIHGRDLISIDYFSRAELDWILDTAAVLKTRRWTTLLRNKSIALLFFNASLRTRSSFDIGMHELGGHVLTLTVGAGVWDLEVEEGVVMDGDKAEHVKDAARVLARYADAICVRSFPKMENWAQERKDLTIINFQMWSDVPIINLESSLYHPCQALADAFTIREKFGALERRKLLLTWTNHPRAVPMAVANSTAIMAGKFGMDLTIAHPEPYALDDEIMRRVQANAKQSGGSVRVVHDFESAFDGQEIVYAKSWGSKNYYGRVAEDLALRREFRHWRVDVPQMERTGGGRFMHCLPVRRNVVVTDAVLDHPEWSIVYDQAENRLHTQKAVLAGILGDEAVHAELERLRRERAS